jgi:uncharacterized protein
MMLRIIRKAQYRTMPWKNGGGTATDIIAFPEGAGYDAFEWRLSGAHVGRDGPFSIFPEIDRTMAILDGEALALHGVPGGSVTLTTLSMPFAFPGDIPVTATLPAGPVDNLNMMSHRGQFQHSMRRITASGMLTPRDGATLLLFLESGCTELIAGEETAVLEPQDTAITRQPVSITLCDTAPGKPAKLIQIEVWRT